MKSKLALIILGLFVISFISAVPPVTTIQQFEDGYVIEEAPHQYIELDKNYQYNFFLYNVSTGKTIDDTNVICTFFLANSSGSVLYMENASYDDYWYVNILAGNFSKPGDYPYGINCEDDYGGALAGIFYVTPVGIELSIPTTIILFFVLGLLSLFLFFSVTGIRKATSGVWMIAYVCLTYVMLYLIISFLYLLSINYLWMISTFENIFYIIWFSMGIGFLPFVIVVTLYILGQEAKAVMQRDFMKQGYTREEAKELSKRRKR